MVQLSQGSFLFDVELVHLDHLAEACQGLARPTPELMVIAEQTATSNR